MAYLDDLKDGGILIVDPDMITEEEVMSFVKEHNIKLFKAPATRTAAEEIGIRIVANIVMIGAITRITKVVSEEAARNAVTESVPPEQRKKTYQHLKRDLNLQIRRKKMKIHEYIAKDIFKGEGIPVPHNKMVVSPAESQRGSN